MNWVRIGIHGAPRDGETDFVFMDPNSGILAIEVKGGRIDYDPGTGKWFSWDRHNQKQSIKDPFQQAKIEKYQLRSFLHEHRLWSPSKEPTFGHAVLFPDLQNLEIFEGPDRPSQIIGGVDELRYFDLWLDSVFEFWAGDGSKPSGFSKQDYGNLKSIFCKPISVRPLLSDVIASEEKERIKLTEEQIRLLRGLGLRNRATISGGAGTGKTLLALEKTVELAKSGKNTLMLCYNRPLSNHLQQCLKDEENVTVLSFHQLCFKFIKMVNQEHSIDLLDDAKKSCPGDDTFDIHYPLALTNSIEYVNLYFDAIIVDEAQDFGEEYWLPIEMLLKDEKESVLFLFYDHNQSIYHRVSTFPIEDPPF